MALKFKIKRETVLDNDGSEIATVRGLSLNDIVGLVTINKDAMEGLFNQFKDRDPNSISEDDINGIGMDMIKSAPMLVGQIIAAAANAYDGHQQVEGEDSPLDVIMAMPVGLQIHFLEKIGRLTFEKGGSPKKLLAQVMKMVGGNLGESASPQT